MKLALLGGAAALALGIGAADAATMRITGSPGAGFVTIQLSGSTNVVSAGSIRGNSAASTEAQDTFELADSILDVGIQDTVFATSASDLTISFNGVTAPITGIYLDHDPSFNSNPEQFSDFGFRADAGLTYSVLGGQDLIFAGEGTIAVDINAFQTPYSDTAAFSVPMFANNEFTVEINAVPLPAALPLLIGGVAALGFVARRRKT